MVKLCGPSWLCVIINCIAVSNGAELYGVFIMKISEVRCGNCAKRFIRTHKTLQHKLSSQKLHTKTSVEHRKLKRLIDHKSFLHYILSKARIKINKPFSQL